MAAGEFLLYQTEDGRTRVECRFVDETLWLTQAGMAELFATTPQNVTQHLKAIFAEGELSAEATCKEDLQVRTEGGRQVQRRVRYYRLEAILAVGYRVRSVRGTQFRRCSRASRSTTSGSRTRPCPASRRRTTSASCWSGCATSAPASGACTYYLSTPSWTGLLDKPVAVQISERPDRDEIYPR